MEVLDIVGVFAAGVCLGWEIVVIVMVLTKKNIYPNGYFLEDKPGHSFVRGAFKSVKKPKSTPKKTTCLGGELLLTMTRLTNSIL